MQVARFTVGLIAASLTLAVTAPADTRHQRATKLDRRLAPEVEAAEQAWRAAEGERDAVKQAELWERAALAFAEVDGATVDANVKREAAYAAVLAWKNALGVAPRDEQPYRNDHKPTPKPLPEREQKLVAAFDRYVGYLSPTDPEVAGALFLKANTLRRYDQYDGAITIFRSLIDRFPRHEVAEYAASLLLDSYNLLGQYDRLVAVADELARNATLLRGRNDLARTVNKIRQLSKRKRVENLEREAERTNDWDRFVAAASAYLEIYHATPDEPDNDEVLYNAAHLFEKGRAIDEALGTYELLEKHYPRSKLVMRSMTHMANLYANTARFDKAADKLEQYAKRYAAEKDAREAIRDAAYFRRALGDRKRAIADAEFFIKTYGAKDPAAAADASWMRIAAAESEPIAITYLEHYLRDFGTKGGAVRVVLAHAKIGALLWKQSCPHDLVDGLCVIRQSLPRACGTGTMQRLAPTRREPNRSKRALASFAEAVTLFERNGGGFDVGTRYYYAQAKLAQVDAELENYLATGLPSGLDLDLARQPQDSIARLTAWRERKQRRGAALTRQYEAVLAAHDVATAITAAGRLATISHAFAAELLTNQVPASRRDRYCSVVTPLAAPLEARAVDGFAACLAKSTELAWFAETSGYCEHQLLELRPDEFPRARELRGQPRWLAPILDRSDSAGPPNP